MFGVFTTCASMSKGVVILERHMCPPSSFDDSFYWNCLGREFHSRQCIVMIELLCGFNDQSSILYFIFLFFSLFSSWILLPFLLCPKIGLFFFQFQL